MFIRSLLIIIGAWLLFRVLRLFGRARTPKQSVENAPNGAEEKNPFRDRSIQDAEFEEVRRKSGGKP